MTSALTSNDELALPDYSLLATLDEAVPEGLRMLAGRHAVERLRAAARLIPAAVTDRVYLELPLDSAAERLDLIVRVDRTTGRWLNPPRGWTCARGLEALAEGWRSDPNPEVAALWLEFDLPSGARAGALPAPRVFLDYSAAEGARSLTAARALAPFRTAATPVVRSKVTSRLERCFGALPWGASVASLGLAHRRGWKPFRICVAGLPATALRLYLQGAGWAGDATAVFQKHLKVERCFATPSPRVDLIHLDVDARQGPPRIGIEYAISRRPASSGVMPEALARLLVEAGVCSPPLLARLAGWPSRAVRRLPHLVWPSLIRRRLNHLKVVFGERGELVQAKAYLRLAHFAGSAVGARPPLAAPGLYLPA